MLGGGKCLKLLGWHLGRFRVEWLPPIWWRQVTSATTAGGVMGRNVVPFGAAWQGMEIFWVNPIRDPIRKGYAEPGNRGLSAGGCPWRIPRKTLHYNEGFCTPEATRAVPPLLFRVSLGFCYFCLVLLTKQKGGKKNNVSAPSGETEAHTIFFYVISYSSTALPGLRHRCCLLGFKRLQQQYCI